MNTKLRKSKKIDHSDSFNLGSSGTKGIAVYLSVFSLLCIWSVVSGFNLVNPLILPSPIRVLGAVSDVGPILIRHLWATVFRVLLSYTLGVGLGIATGVLMQYNRKVFCVLDGLVETFRPVPPVALIPFFILIFGFSESGKIVITTLGVWLLITVTAVEAIERVPAAIIRWGLVVGLKRRELFRKIILPASWPEMRTGFRIALALAITLVIVSEFMGATYGMGYLISVSKVTLTTPTIFLSIMILGWTGWLLDRTLRLIFQLTTKWDIRAKGATR